MWFQRGWLLPESDTLQAAHQFHDPEALDELRTLVEEVRAFAFGEIDIDLDRYANPNARFIDVHAAVHRIKRGFSSRNVLGVDTRGFELDRHELIGIGATTIAILSFVRQSSTGDKRQSITWTLTWLRDGGTWRILNSHASRN